jgi:hypothetical protein
MWQCLNKFGVWGSDSPIVRCPQSCSLFGTWLCVWPCCFHLASSHHHPDMNFYYIFLLLVVLSVYSESPEPPDLLDLTVVAICPNSRSNSLGFLAPVLPHEVFGSQNVILPQNEVYRTNFLPQSEVFGFQNVILPQNEVFRTVLLQNEAFEIVLPQNEVNISVLPQGGIFRVVIVNCPIKLKLL